MRYWAAGIAVFAVMGFFVMIGGKFPNAASLWREEPPTLDKAQAAFEADPATGRGYNWPWYHQKKAGMDLRCSDTADGSLRFCTVVLPYVHPKTLEPLGVSFDSFACSKTTCGWVESGPVDINP